jgi:hypothetical protein
LTLSEAFPTPSHPLETCASGYVHNLLNPCIGF